MPQSSRGRDPSDLVPITKDGEGRGIVIIPFTNPRYLGDGWKNQLHFECVSSMRVWVQMP